MRFIAAILATVAEEARTDPDLVKNAPYNSTIDQIDYAAVEDPARWAFTWRAYQAKGLDFCG